MMEWNNTYNGRYTYVTLEMHVTLPLEKKKKIAVHICKVNTKLEE